MDEQSAIKKYLVRNIIQRLEIKAALIDMDGVLYDSMKNHTAAWYRMVKELGIDCDRDEFYLYEGMTGAATINLLFKRAFGHPATREQMKELYHKKTVYFSELPKPEPMQGAAHMLEILKQNDITPVLVTGSGQNSLINRLNADYPDMFMPQNKITAHDVKHGKPNPEPYLKGLELVKLQPYQAIVIENAPLGVAAGHASGCFTIAITTGPIPESKLWENGADIVYKSMPEFADSLPGLLEEMKETVISCT